MSKLSCFHWISLSFFLLTVLPLKAKDPEMTPEESIAFIQSVFEEKVLKV
jgi:hypothetical protein